MEGYGNKYLIEEKYVNYQIVDNKMEYVMIDPGIHPGYPGIPLNMHALR